MTINHININKGNNIANIFEILVIPFSLLLKFKKYFEILKSNHEF